MFGQELYTLNPRELQMTTLEIVTFDSTATAGATQYIGFPNASDRVMQITHYSVLSTAGVLQTLLECELGLNHQDPISFYAPFCIIEEFTSADGFTGERYSPIMTTANQDSAWARSCNILVPPGDWITLRAIYNAGANPNTTRLSLFGCQIPKGNFVS